MKNVFLPAIFISILFLVSVANASLTITASATSSALTTGTSITVTAQFQADSNGGSGSFSLSCTPSTGYTVSEGSQSVNLGASASTTLYYTFTPSVAGTYSDCKVTDGQTSSGTMTFSVVNPSTIAVDGQINGVSSTSITKNGGDSFTLTVYVGPASSATTSSYTLTPGSSLTASGNDPTSGTLTIPASGSTSKSWTIALASGFTSGTSTVTFQLGSNSNAYTATVTGSTNASSATTTTTTTTGTGANASTAAKIKVNTTRGNANITIPSIAAGKMANVSINKTEDVAIRYIEISVRNSVNNIQIIITKLAGSPASITQSVIGKVYHYIQIDKTNITDGDINKTKIQFKVEKNWTTANNINESTIALQRYADDIWNKLTTTRLTDDTDYFYFESESPGLSVFAITGEQKITVSPTEEKPTQIESVSKAVKKVPIWLYAIFILSLTLSAMFFFKYRGKIRARV